MNSNRLPSFKELCSSSINKSQPSFKPVNNHDDALKKLILALNKDILPQDSVQGLQNRDYILSRPDSPQERSSLDEPRLDPLADLQSGEKLFELLEAIQQASSVHQELVPYMDRINSDFILSLKNSANIEPENTRENEVFNLSFNHGQRQTFGNYSHISRSDLKAFLQSIPMQALSDCIKNIDILKETLSQWLNYREIKQRQSRRSLPLPVNKESCDHSQTSFPSGSKSLDEYSLSSNRSDSTPMFEAVSERSSASPRRKEKDLIDEIKAERKKEKLAALGISTDLRNSEFVQVCLQCDSDDTPEWRRGPYGPRSLCNACGLFYGKLIKKFGKEEAATVMRRRKEQGNGKDRRIPID